MDEREESLNAGADKDTEARIAIWKAIIICAEQLDYRCSALMRVPGKRAPQAIIGRPIPKKRTWQLIEGLSLLGILLRAETVLFKEVTLFVKAGPLELVEEGETRYLWSQHMVVGRLSGLDCKPDLVVTKTKNLPSAANISRIVEVKCTR